jgi:hypothetical protein
VIDNAKFPFQEVGSPGEIARKAQEADYVPKVSLHSSMVATKPLDSTNHRFQLRSNEDTVLGSKIHYFETHSANWKTFST